MDIRNYTLDNSLTNATNSTNEEEEFSSVKSVIIMISVIILILIIVVGNLSVILSVAIFKKMQTVQNVFLCSLSISDILLAVFILPLNLSKDLLGYWPFGKIMCKLALSCDIVLCTASIWNISLIGINRYWAVTRGAAYRNENTVKRAIFMVLLAWMWSGFVSLPPFFYSNSSLPEDKDSLICSHSSETWYILFSVSCSFYIPLTVMLFTYCRINTILNNQARQTQFQDMVLIRQRRLHITTGLILAAFIVFWLPFFQSYVILALCTDCGNHDILLKVLEWFAYCNSAVNPFIYNINNKEMTEGLQMLYQKLFRCGKKVTGNSVISLVGENPEISNAEDSTAHAKESRVIARAVRSKSNDSDTLRRLSFLPQASMIGSYSHHETDDQLSTISEEANSYKNHIHFVTESK